MEVHGSGNVRPEKNCVNEGVIPVIDANGGLVNANAFDSFVTWK